MHLLNNVQYKQEKKDVSNVKENPENSMSSKIQKYEKISQMIDSYDKKVGGREEKVENPPQQNLRQKQEHNLKQNKYYTFIIYILS